MPVQDRDLLTAQWTLCVWSVDPVHVELEEMDRTGGERGLETLRRGLEV